MATTTSTLVTEAHDLQNIYPGTARGSLETRVWDDPGRTIAEPPAPNPSNVRIATTVVQLASINLLSSFTNGVITVGLPTIARDISLARELYLWPISVFGLTCGSMLLMAGSITDVVGARRVELVGCFMLGVFSLACGLAATGIQLTLFRAFQGVAMAIHLPATVSIVTATVPKGKARNMSFAALGFARDIGYSVGLVLSGVLIQKSGWRLNFFLAGGAMLILATVAVWGLPKEKDISTASAGSIKELYHKIDWVGSIIISGGLALLAYVLA
jgi:MFS family permease